MKQKLTLMVFLLGCLFSTNAMAQQTLVVWQKNGQKVYFNLAEEPHTTFENGKLVITTSSMRTEYQLSSIIRYTYEGERTDIPSLPINGQGFTQKGDDIEIRGVQADAAVQLYSPNGILLDTCKPDEQQIVRFTLENRPAGTYIVRVGDQTIKFMKR